VHLIWLKIEAAIARAELFDPLHDCATGFLVLQAGSNSDTGKATEMDEIQMLSVAEAPHVGPNFFHRQLSLKRNQSIDAKDSVVEITSAGAIGKAPIPIELSKQKIVHERGGIPEDFRREPSHLDHL
jgi:hypothetical protein